MRKTLSGFTIVELFVVVVIIGIVATISIVGYSSAQARARDTKRRYHVTQLTSALELYYNENGQYPASAACGSTTINTNWCTTADASWANLVTQLQPHLSDVPALDPRGVSAVPAISGGYNYDYFSWGSTYCGQTTASRQMYLLTYRLEGSAQIDTFSGACPATVVGGAYTASEYRIVR